MSDAELMQLKVPPHSLEAEQSLLGALLLDNQAFERVDFLRPEHFYRDDHRRIWSHIAKIIERGREADMVTVSASIEASDDKEKAGGPAYLAELAQSVPSSLNIKRYAELVRDKFFLRELATRGTYVAEMALAGTTEPRALVEEAEGSFLSILDSEASGEAVHVGQAVTEYIEWTDVHPKGIETNFADLDAMLGGLHPGHLVVIAGRPSMGKTALALQFAETICQTVPGQMFSLEATRRELAGRLVNWHRQRLGRDGAVDRVFNLKLFIDDTAAISPSQIRTRLRRMKRQHGIAMVVVDYLQLCRGKGESREQVVASITADLKAIAKDFSVPVIALSQLSRKVEDRTDKRPTMSDLRESGAIEQDADVILFPFRPDYYDQNFEAELAEAEIIVSKNRGNGRTGVVKLSYSRTLNRFGDYVPGLFNNKEAA